MADSAMDEDMGPLLALTLSRLPKSFPIYTNLMGR
jgi:hypothetical protein